MTLLLSLFPSFSDRHTTRARARLQYSDIIFVPEVEHSSLAKELYGEGLLTLGCNFGILQRTDFYLCQQNQLFQNFEVQ